MVKLWLVIGAVLAVTVSRTDGIVTLPNQAFIAQQGRNVSFSCVVTGESFVAWVTPAKPARPGRPAIPSVKIPASQTTAVNRRSMLVSGDTYELRTESVIVDDGGEYICEGSVNGAVFTLQVDFETGQVVAKQELHLSRNGTIRLDVSAYPPLTFNWSKDGQQLIFPMAGKTLDPYTGSISIENVQESDEGNYSCTVEFVTADTVKIEVTTLSEPKIRKYQGDPVTRRLTRGNNVTFHCDVEAGHPKPEVTWYFGWADTQKKVDPVYDARFTYPTDESWSITGIETMDQGKYRCIAKNKAGEDDLRFEITQVDVPPTIDPLTDIIANDGDKVDLECVAAGQPIPTVEWCYRGNNCTGQTTFKRGEKKVAQISFASVHLVNTGEYTCQATNGALDGNGDVIEVEETVNLFVRSPPQINEGASPSPIYSFVGNRRPVDVTCTFYGYPVPTVIMRDKNGTEIERGNSTVSYTVSDTTEDDFGKFNCTAESPNGMAQYLVELRKAEPPGPTRNVTANRTCKDITLRWKHPLDNGGMNITSYIITVLSNGTQLYTETVDRFTVEHGIGYSFTPETLYKVRLHARSEAGLGDEETVFVTTYKYCVIGKPFITNTYIEVDTEFTVTWSAPQNHSDDNNTKYRLEWRKKPVTNDSKEGREENINETRFRITGLQHNAEYEIKLYAVYRQRESEPDVRTFKTKPKAGVIGKPSITNTDIEVNTEFTVTWSAPQNHSDNNNTKYRLEWRKKPVTNDSKVGRGENINETRFRITGLQHNAEYEIKLYAVYRQRESEPDVRTFKTKPKFGAPERPIIYLPSSTLVTKDSFTLKWRRPEETGDNDDITYTVRYQVVGDKNPSLWITKTITTKELQLKICDLVNKVFYKFEVIAKNKGGESLSDKRLIETNFSGEGSSQSRLVSSAALTILVGGLVHLF